VVTVAAVIAFILLLTDPFSDRPDAEGGMTDEDAPAASHEAKLEAQRAVIQAAKNQQAADDAIIARYRERMGG
jgi:hypothetical protein